MSPRHRSRSSHTRTGTAVAPVLRGVAVAACLAVLPGVAGAAPTDRAQSIGSLQERARKIASELEQLDERTNTLDERYNSAMAELDTLREQLAANQSDVDAARKELDATRKRAQNFAVNAYVSGDDSNVGSLVGVADDAIDASRRRTYLASQYGESADVIDGLVASQKDLADREAGLESASAVIDGKVAELDRSRAAIEATIAERKQLQASVEGELAEALAAEQERQRREAEAKARAEAEAAAARAAAARRPQAVAVQPARAGGSGGVTAAAVPSVTAAPATRNLVPPPSDAPAAVQLALAQQGDPYKWAADGPDSFDCSGLVMFAYRAANLSLPHSSRALRSMTRSLSADELQPGDLVFGGSPVHHVGIYIGNGQMVHAPHSGDVVKVSSMYSTSKPVTFGRL